MHKHNPNKYHHDGEGVELLSKGIKDDGNGKIEPPPTDISKPNLIGYKLSY